MVERKVAVSLIVIGVVIMSAIAIGFYIQQTPSKTPTPTPPRNVISEYDSLRIAREYVKNDSTFQFDGIEETLKHVGTLELPRPYSWLFNFTFDSRHAGYGDRSEQMLAEVITAHTARITLEGGKVVFSVMDGVWDIMKQEMIGTISDNLHAYFNERIESIAVERVGQPIHGFDPFLLMQAFPGLEVQDFNGVEALQGIYRVVDGELIFEEIKADTVHSAARTISEDGMKTFLNNLSIRFGIPVTDEGSVNRILEASDHVGKPPVGVEALTSRKWVLKSFVSDGQQVSLIAGIEIAIQFDNDGNVTGSGGCNTFSGSYRIDGYITRGYNTEGNITLGPIAHTEKACQEGMEQEACILKRS